MALIAIHLSIYFPTSRHNFLTSQHIYLRIIAKIYYHIFEKKVTETLNSYNKKEELYLVPGISKTDFHFF